MTKDRRHAAIMFTDIVGYTTLMGSDEDRAFEVLKENRKIHSKYLHQFNGTLIKEIGDGMLLSFNLASAAVRCAIKIQKASKEQDIPLKIGIHEGEMVFEGNDVLGDGVNIAARIQDNTNNGCITISGSVYRDIKNKADIKAEFIGEKSFKNVDEPIKVYKVFCSEMLEKNISPLLSEQKVPEKKSIIVLPFVNMSPDPDQEYFSDGLTEEIITDLSHIQDLLVISRSSAMTFKGSKKKIRDIAREVNVQYVLEGSVRKAGNGLRITAQLIDGISDTHLWAEKYTGTLDEVFDIQEEVSRSIVDALKIRLSPTEITNVKKRKIKDAIAYEQYLLARNEIWKCTKESLTHAIQILNTNLEKIGRNEYLLIALGTAYFQYVNAGIDPDVKHLDKADELIDEALALNPSSVKAYYLKSMVHETRGELKETFIALKKALVLDPNDSEALLMMTFMYVLVGQTKEAKPLAKLALKIDPLNPVIYFGQWWVCFSEGKLDKLLETSLKMHNLDKESPLGIYTYAQALALNSEQKKATKLFDYIIENFPDEFYSDCSKIFRHAINGEKQETLQSITGKIEKAAEMDHLIAWFLAEAYAIIGEKNKAIDWVERGTRDIFINYPIFAKHDPLLSNIRGEERFKQLMISVKERWENFDITEI